MVVQIVSVPSAKFLATLLGVEVRLLYLLSNQTEKFYRIYQIPKKNGNFRTIEAPDRVLKLVQKRILALFLGESPSCIATAFCRGRGIKANAAAHCAQEVLLKMDVKDFFPSLSFFLVMQYFLKRGFEKNIAVLLAKLCTLNGHLPQGAPSSPALSNLLLVDFDQKLSARYSNCKITRYADDITVSGNLSSSDIADILHFCRSELAKLKLRLNREKISVQRKGARQLVTGLVVNEKVAVPARTRRKVRQTMYYLNKFWSAESALLSEPHLNQLLGTVNFIWDIDRENAEMSEYRRQLLEIKQYFNRKRMTEKSQQVSNLEI